MIVSNEEFELELNKKKISLIIKREIADDLKDRYENDVRVSKQIVSTGCLPDGTPYKGSLDGFKEGSKFAEGEVQRLEKDIKEIDEQLKYFE
jgi:hypothetical protein